MAPRHNYFQCIYFLNQTTLKWCECCTETQKHGFCLLLKNVEMCCVTSWQEMVVRDPEGAKVSGTVLQDCLMQKTKSTEAIFFLSCGRSL